MSACLETLAVAIGLKKDQFSFQSQRSIMPNNVQTTGTITLISHASQVMFKILQGKVSQYMNQEFPYIEAVFRKGRGTRDQIANICWIMEKTREFQENIYFASLTTLKPLCGSQPTVENS